MKNWVSNGNWVGNSMSQWVGNSMSQGVGNSLWIDSCAFISNLSNISIIVVGVVVNNLSTAIGKSNRVRSSGCSSTVIGLLSIEGSLGVVIRNTIGVGEGRWFREIINWVSSRICWGSMMNNWGMVGRGSVNNWGNMDNWGSMVC